MTHAIKRTIQAALALLATVLMLALTAGGASAQDEGTGGLLCSAPQPFHAGMQLAVLPGPDLPIYTIPTTVNGQQDIFAYAPANSVLYVLEGPRCADYVNWWRISVGEVVGWVPEHARGQLRLTPPGSGTFCQPLVGTRLGPGMQARVTPGLPNVIRAEPGGGARLGLIPAGGVMTLLNGPACANSDQWWWQVNYDGVIGWTGEADGYDYWLEPYHTPPGCSPSPRLQAGITGVVRPGPANALRELPGLNASGSTVIGRLAGGATFNVISGPVCQDGHNWWQVTAGGQTGWTAEGEGNTYWVDPIVCANGMAARIAPGMNVRVTPGLPNRLRAQPNTNSAILARMPQGHTMRVLSDFQCGPNGRLWWRVNYDGITGWTVEGDAGYYWLSPS